jgi:hypothetical protein
MFELTPDERVRTFFTVMSTGFFGMGNFVGAVIEFGFGKRLLNTVLRRRLNNEKNGAIKHMKN